MNNKEYVAAVFNSLTESNKAAWASCVMLSDMVKDRDGESSSRFEIVKSIVSIGAALHNSFGLKSWVDEFGVESVEALYQMCLAERASISEGDDNRWGLTDSEYPLFYNVVMSNLFYGIKNAVAVIAGKGSCKSAGSGDYLGKVSFDPRSNSIVFDGFNRTMSISVRNEETFCSLINKIMKLERYSAFSGSAVTDYTTFIDSTIGDHTNEPFAPYFRCRSFSDITVSLDCTIYGKRVFDNTGEYIIVFCCKYEDDELGQQELFLLPSIVGVRPVDSSSAQYNGSDRVSGSQAMKEVFKK